MVDDGESWFIQVTGDPSRKAARYPGVFQVWETIGCLKTGRPKYIYICIYIL